VKDYYSRIRKMVRIACPDIIGHIDKIKIHNSVELFFDEEDKWYKNEVLQTLEEIKKAGATVEVNTRGMYKKLTSEPYPGKMILTELKKMNIPVCLNSDSHQPDDITAQFQNVAELLQIIGFKTVRILKNHQWEDVRFTRQGMDI